MLSVPSFHPCIFHRYNTILLSYFICSVCYSCQLSHMFKLFYIWHAWWTPYITYLYTVLLTFIVTCSIYKTCQNQNDRACTIPCSCDSLDDHGYCSHKYYSFLLSYLLSSSDSTFCTKFQSQDCKILFNKLKTG